MKKLTNEEIIKRAVKVHGMKYDYSLVDYKNCRTKIKIICKKHGIFSQRPYQHLNDSGCPSCKESKGEKKITEILKKYKIGFETQKTFDDLKYKSNLYYDFYIPTRRLLIEYNGIQHWKPIDFFGGKKALIEQKKRDKIKFDYSLKMGYLLITLYNVKIKYIENLLINAIKERPKIMSLVSPYYLPQIRMPFKIVLQNLTNEKVDYIIDKINPDKLKASQPVTLSHVANDAIIDDNNPIWVDNDLNIIDGHHKWVRALSEKLPIMAIKIKMDFKDACRLLNKIQDIHDYEESVNTETTELEEVQMQDAINYYGDDENQFLNNLEEDNTLIQDEYPSQNEKTIIAYRKEPIKENSVVGNFFSLNPIEGFNKYEIDFENLLDTHVLGIIYKDSQEPVEFLAKIWFPNINFEKISQQYNISPLNLKNKAIAEKAIKLGFDGIKYGDTLVQGLK